MLAKMFAEDSELPPAYKDSQGRFFIDRDGKYFGTILSYLREQPFDIPTSRSEREALTEEARFFQVYTLQAPLSICQGVRFPAAAEHQKVLGLLSVTLRVWQVAIFSRVHKWAWCNQLICLVKA